jgi:hypothetical protein
MKRYILSYIGWEKICKTYEECTKILNKEI